MDNPHHTLHNLTLLNWNTNGVKSQRAIFISFLARYKVDIACITETHLSEGEIFKINGYHIYRQDRLSTTSWGGVAILIKRNIEHSTPEDTITNSLETIAININTSNKNQIKIVSAYKQPKKTLSETDIIKIFNSATQTLVIGDLNSKSTYWGCRANNPSGTKLNNFAITHQLQIIPPNEFTYYPYRLDQQPDILDIVVAKNFPHPIQQNVIPELDSDHLPVIITFTTTPVYTPKLPKLIEGYVKWDLFKEKLDAQLDNPSRIDNRPAIDDQVTALTTAITESIHLATIPNRTRKMNNFNIPPNYILDLIKQKSRLRREWQRCKNPVIKNQLNNISHRIRREIDTYRVNNYRKYLENIEPTSLELWKATKKITRQYDVIPTLTENNSSYTTDEDKCELFSKHLEKVFTPTIADENRGHANAVQSYVETHLPIVNDFDDPTSPKELESYILALPLKKAPGHDLISNIILKHISSKALAFLSSLFNACMRIGYFPATWKLAHILMFPKQGQNKKNCSNYRPISLLPTLSKLLEKVVAERLKIRLNERQIIPPEQFGFRQGQSAVQQLQRISEIISKGFENKQFTVIAFLDVTKAFDKVWTEGLKYKLLRINIPQYLVAIIFSFLEDRKFLVRVNSTTSTVRNIHAGVPQGSILGPTLFNIFTHDIPTLKPTEVALFADDMAVISQHEELLTTIDHLQTALNTLTKWLTKWGIKLNATKCTTKIFTLKRIHDHPNINIFGTDIPWNPRGEAVKYLGVHMDTRLTWSNHVNRKLNQGYARLQQLYPLINRNTPLRRECVLLLYKTLLRPVITYACPVWSTTSATNFRKMQAFQNKILRLALKAPWYMRNEQIHYELAMDKVDQFIFRLTKNFFDNIRNSNIAILQQLGRKNIFTRLKRRLPQDIIA